MTTNEPLSAEFVAPFVLGGAQYPTLLAFVVCMRAELVTRRPVDAVPLTARATRVLYRSTPRPDREQHAEWKRVRGRLLGAAVLAQVKTNFEMLQALGSVDEGVRVSRDDPEARWLGGEHKALENAWKALRDRLAPRRAPPGSLPGGGGP